MWALLALLLTARKEWQVSLAIVEAGMHQVGLREQLLLLRPLGWSTLATWSVLTFAVVPVVIAICYGFFWLVESRCLNSRQRHAVTEMTQPEDSLARRAESQDQVDHDVQEEK